MMKIRILILTICITFSCKEQLELNYKVVNLDSVISKLKDSRIIDESLFRIRESAILTNEEIYQVRELLEKSFKNYNKTNYYKEILKIKEYRLFFIPYRSSKNEKLVRIHAYCFDGEEEEWWEFEYLYGVEDGGSCYFGLVVNLSLNKEGVIIANGRA